ncbi:hypothetical protein GCM10023321_17050 [Pseudonocardia eucalypti]|uniref:PPM-type phosphatase domain-containing protein n=2 Tax=Pseudonocardia eucalypti TaxID=648755 RepID=A0ABP9PRL9_9PSEU
MLRAALGEAGLAAHNPDDGNNSGDTDHDLIDIVLLLASELCDNATLHAGTEYEVEVDIDSERVLVTVTDHGAGPLELYLGEPRPRFGRASSHGRGLLLVERLSSAWGTRHERGGTHRTWFSVSRGDHPVAETSEAQEVPDFAKLEPTLPDADQVRRLLHMPARLAARLDTPTLATELSRRLREMLAAEWVTVDVDHGDGGGTVPLAQAGSPPVTLVGVRFQEFALPLTAPLRGTLRVPTPGGVDLRTSRMAELTAERIALTVELDWLRGADLRRRSWMTYLADASELLGQSMNTDLVVALVPQVVVPRLGQWCAVYLLGNAGGPPGTAGRQYRLAAITHATEDVVPELRTALEDTPPVELARYLKEMTGGATAPAWFSDPTDGIVVALTVHGRPIGALAVGRPARRSHTPEDVALVGDIARRASLAIDNAQSTAAHIATSQALQHALLPRGLPDVEGVDFAAEYLPASAGSDVGGDFYDILSVQPYQWLASIGDVCGKGAAAAARTGMVRDVLRVLVREGRSLKRAVQLLNDVMMDAADPYQFCTLATALVTKNGSGEPPGLTIELLLAGHPQPMLVRADGRCEFIGAHGTAVGLVSSPKLVTSTHRLEPGDTFVAYTDGVTERRRGREQFGPDRLLAAAAQGAGQTSRQLITSIRNAVESFSATPPNDDIALLALRLATTAT